VRRATSQCWFLAILAALILVPAGVRAQSITQFETFVLPAPVRPQQAVHPKHNNSTVGGNSAGHASKPTTAVRTEVTATVFPGMNGVSANSSGNIGARDLSSNFNSVQDPNGRPTDTGFMQVEQGGSGVELGSNIPNTVGAFPGIRFFSSPDHDPVSTGAGLYVFQDSAGRSRVVPMVDASRKIGQGQTLTCGVGTGGTFASTYSRNKGSWQANLQTVYSKDTRTSEQSVAVRKQLSSSSSAYARVSNENYAGGQLTSYGWIKRIGAPTVSLDSYTFSDSSLRVAQNRLGFFLPLRARTLAVQCFTENLTPQSGSSERAGQTTTLNTEIYSHLNSKLSVWQSLGFTSGATGHGRPAFDALFGIDRILSNQWRFSTSLDQGFGSNQLTATGTIEYALSPELRLRFLYGPKLDYVEPGLGGTGFGFQVVRDFNYDYVPSGSISGAIFIEGQPCNLPVEVAVDDGAPVTCDNKGKFDIRHVDLGDHTVTLVPESLTADLSSEESSCPVTIANGQTVTCAFHLHKVGEVDGTVTAMPDQLGQTDPTARVAVVIKDDTGDVTSTDINGLFNLANLRSGTYTISIDERSLPTNYEVQPPKTQQVTVLPGHPTPQIQFSIMPVPQKVVFSSAGS
jgi:hypothetical protein